MEKLQVMMRNLRWQVELATSIYPEAVACALETAAADVDYYPETEFTLETIFTYSSPDIVVALLDELCANLPVVSSPVFTAITKNWKALAEFILSNRPPDSVLAKAWSEETEGLVQLYDPLALYAMGTSQTKSTVERDARNQHIFERLVSTGPCKRFGFGAETVQRLEDLKSRAPNFEAVIERIIDAVVVSTRFQKPIQITPMLLVGEPGIGKTFFTNQLASCIDVSLQRIAMDNLQTGMVLAGSSYTWSNSETGMVFKVLTNEDHISPLIILDEIDKATDGYSSRVGDALNPLHNLLEPVSAKVFQDASFPLILDASHVIWVSTANDIHKIPETIKSRFEILEIRRPSPKELGSVLKKICTELSQEYPGVVINRALFEELSAKTPREQRQLLQRAVARAIRLGDDEVGVEHLQQVAPSSTKPKTTFGYHNFVT